MSNGSFWTPQQWMQLNGNPNDRTQPGLLKTTMGPMEVAQQVFPTIVTGNDNPILADTIDLQTGEPSTGATIGVATLRKPFKLAFPVQVNDPALTMASNQVTMAGQALALAEDRLFFQGRHAAMPVGAQDVTISQADKEKLKAGLLGIAADNETIDVPRGPKGKYGLETYNQVFEGVTHFGQLQGPPYALILSPDIFADANRSTEDHALVTPASAIQPLLRSGPFVMSPGMPDKTGLLASLGGKTTTLYIGTGPLVEYIAYDGSAYSFAARESIQFLNIDKRSLIKLRFEP